MAKARSSGATPVVTSEVAKTIGPAPISNSVLLDVTSTPPMTSGIMSGSCPNGSVATGRTSRFSCVRRPQLSCAACRSISQEPAQAPIASSGMPPFELLVAIEACHSPPMLCRIGLYAGAGALHFENCVRITLPQPPWAFLGYERPHKTGVFPWLLRCSLDRGPSSTSDQNLYPGQSDALALDLAIFLSLAQRGLAERQCANSGMHR